MPSRIVQSRVSAQQPASKRDFFVYTATFGSLAPGASQQIAVQVQADSAFELQKMSFLSVLSTNAVDLSAQLAVQITDSGTGRSIFSAAASVPSVFGSGEIPFILPTSKLFSENASIILVLTNVHAANTYTSTRMSLIGTKIFRY